MVDAFLFDFTSYYTCQRFSGMIHTIFALQHDECIFWGTRVGRQKWTGPSNTSWCIGEAKTFETSVPLSQILLGRLTASSLLELLGFTDCQGHFLWQDLGAIANPMFKMKGPSMIQGSYPPAFPLKHQQKDMRLALALGDENSVSMPVAAAANEVYN